MRLVKQEDKTGCAIAAVAMLGGVTYQKVIGVTAHYGISVKDPRLWSETSYMRKLLNHFGIKPSKKEMPFVSWDGLPHLALLAVKWHREGTHAR